MRMDFILTYESRRSAIDLFQSSHMGVFYGANVEIREIEREISFDYSNHKLLSQIQHEVDKELCNGVILEFINFFPDTRTRNGWSINLFFDRDVINEYSREHDVVIHLHWVRDSVPDGLFERRISLNNQLYINGKHFISIPLGNIRPQDVMYVQLRVVDSITGD